MARTISQIAGDFGLARNATSDPFAKTEEATLANVQRQLEEIRSQGTELATAQGVGRSTFTQGIQARQEEGILGQVFQQLQGARLQEDLNETNFERGIVGAGVQADIQEQAAQSGFGREVSLLGEQGRIASAARQEAGTISGTLVEQQADLQAKRDEQLFKQAQTTQERQFELGEQAGAGALTRQQQLSQTQADLQKDILGEQAAIAGTAREQAAGIASTQLSQQAQIAKDQAVLQTGLESSLIDDRAVAQISAINQQFDNQIATLNEQIRLLPAEIDQKIRFSNETKAQELQLQKQQAIDAVVLQLLGTGITKILGDFGEAAKIGDTLNEILGG